MSDVNSVKKKVHLSCESLFDKFSRLLIGEIDFPHMYDIPVNAVIQECSFDGHAISFTIASTSNQVTFFYPRMPNMGMMGPMQRPGMMGAMNSRPPFPMTTAAASQPRQAKPLFPSAGPVSGKLASDIR